MAKGFFAVLFALLYSSWGGVAWAEDQSAAPTSPSIVAQVHAPMPANVADLDAALKAKDWAQLNRLHNEIKDANALLLMMNWEQVRSFDGAGGIFLSLRYMDDLWQLGSMMQASNPDEASQLKGSAVMLGLYSYALIAVDGVKCTDPSAVGHRADQLMTRPAWTAAHDIPDTMRTKMVEGIVLLERDTGSKRPDDDVLCMGGMTQMILSLGAMAKAGKEPTLVPNAPRMIGKTYEVPPAPATNLFVAEETWRPAQEKRRAALPEELANLMKTVASFTPPEGEHKAN
jgi:hypothetical protein